MFKIHTRSHNTLQRFGLAVGKASILFFYVSFFSLFSASFLDDCCERTSCSLQSFLLVFSCDSLQTQPRWAETRFLWQSFHKLDNWLFSICHQTRLAPLCPACYSSNCCHGLCSGMEGHMSKKIKNISYFLALYLPLVVVVDT